MTSVVFFDIIKFDFCFNLDKNTSSPWFHGKFSRAVLLQCSESRHYFLSVSLCPLVDIICIKLNFNLWGRVDPLKHMLVPVSEVKGANVFASDQSHNEVKYSEAYY